jgi:uncharacterized protein
LKNVEENKKSLNIRHLLVIIIILIIIIAIIVSIKHFTLKKVYSPPTSLAVQLPRFRLIDMDRIGDFGDRDSDGINNQKDIMLGAKKQLDRPARNIFLEENEPNYYQGGDPPGELAISTDIIARAFMEAGFDLREMVHEDVNENFDEYPLRKIWGQTKSDKNIDYRRIQNLEVFFSRNATHMSILFDSSDIEGLDQWLPGDIVLFDMDGDGFTDSAGIISDSTTREQVPKVIYNYIDPGYTIEEDILREKNITGHYRFPD